MAQDGLGEGLAAASALLGAMRPSDDRAALLAFNGTASVLVPITSERGAIDAGLRNVAVAPGTRLDRALVAAMDELLRAGMRPDAAAVIVLITDGQQYEEPASARAAARSAQRHGVSVYALGFGSDVDEGLLVDLTGDPGRYRRAPGAQEVALLYESMAAGVGP